MIYLKNIKKNIKNPELSKIWQSQGEYTPCYHLNSGKPALIVSCHLHVSDNGDFRQDLFYHPEAPRQVQHSFTKAFHQPASLYKLPNTYYSVQRLYLYHIFFITILHWCQGFMNVVNGRLNCYNIILYIQDHRYCH